MSSVAVGATEPEPGPQPKRRRLLDAGGSIEDDETARRKMRDAFVYKLGVNGTNGNYDGFDPDNIGDIKRLYLHAGTASTMHNLSAMGYFARLGDLPMMRWLYANGADTRDEDVGYWFPMWLAVVNGNVEVCKWLFAHGAAGDIKRRSRVNHPPLLMAAPFLPMPLATSLDQAFDEASVGGSY